MSTKEEIMKLADDYADAAATVILSTNTFGRDSAMANSRADDRTKPRDSLLKAVEQLAADAARYRFLRLNYDDSLVMYGDNSHCEMMMTEELDRAIDAAMKGKTP